MKNLLFKLPKDENRDLFFKILSKEMKVEKELLDVLYEYYGETVYFFYNMFSGKSVKFPLNFDNIGMMIKVYNEMDKMENEYNMEFDKCIEIVAEKFNLTTNKVFIYYDAVKHINKEFENNKKKFF